MISLTRIKTRKWIWLVIRAFAVMSRKSETDTTGTVHQSYHEPERSVPKFLYVWSGWGSIIKQPNLILKRICCTPHSVGVEVPAVITGPIDFNFKVHFNIPTDNQRHISIQYHQKKKKVIMAFIWTNFLHLPETMPTSRINVTVALIGPVTPLRVGWFQWWYKKKNLPPCNRLAPGKAKNDKTGPFLTLVPYKRGKILTQLW